MAIEIASRLVTVLIVAGFAWLLARGRIPLIAPGRWTVLAFFAAGLGACTLAGMRDGIGPEGTMPGWLTSLLTVLGIGAAIVALAVIVGLSWRIGVALEVAVVAASWALTFGYGITTASPTVASGAITVAAAFVAWVVIGRASAEPRATGAMFG